MKDSYTLEIAAPPAKVFALINDSDSQKQWIPNLVEDERLTITDEVVGSTFRQVYLENGRRSEMEGEVVVYLPDEYLACEIRGKAFDLVVDYTLEDLGGRTKLTQNVEILFKSVPLKLITSRYSANSAPAQPCTVRATLCSLVMLTLSLAERL